MRWLIKHSILLLVYVVFTVSGSLCLHEYLKYRGIDTWPSVNAEIVSAGGGLNTIPTQSRYGAGTTSIDSRFVEFQYTVEGKVYKTKTSGGVPPIVMGEPWMAYYNPLSPDIALLSRTPNWSAGLIITAAFTGLIVLVHVWFEGADVIKRVKEGEQDVTGNGH